MKAVVVIALVTGGLLSGNAAGLRINTTSSMPRGVWSLVTDDRTPIKGNIIAVCPPDGPQTELARRRG